jgi:glycosyltransferase involved in cell wall biosynthesis
MANFYWKIESNLPAKIESGVCAVIPIEGYGYFLDGATKEIAFRLGKETAQPMSIHQPRNDVFQSNATLDRRGYSQVSGFWGLLKVPQSLAGQTLELTLEAVGENGRRFRTVVGTVQIVRQLMVEKVPAKKRVGDKPLVAICMATFNPKAGPFGRQTQSIINQTYPNWICIVNDDGSDSDKFKLIQQICAKDERFYLFQNKTNLGFYGNFEMTLRRVPDDAEYVAMADQDDVWYSEKIERCVERFGPDTQLVYSDMRIVTDDGQVIADTYWVNRRNNHRDMYVILLANTVTGAASVFRRSLLAKIIPFPERIGDAFHDNWIALSALMVGKIEYVDEPLYDYIQYSGHVIGHCDFDSLTVKGRFMRLRTYASAYTRVFGKKIIKTDLDLKSFKRNLMLIKDYFLTEGRKNYRLLQAVYQHEYRRLQLFSRTLTARTRPETDDQRFALNLFTGKDATLSKLTQAHFKISREHHTTNDAEIRLMLSFIANRVSTKIARWSRKRNVDRNFRQIRNRELEMQHATQFLAQKMAPLKIISDASVPRQVNILIPTIDLNLLFGGYIGKLNLARRFVACGYSVRVIIVDECDFVPVGLNGTLPSVSPLAAEFSKIKFQYCFDRGHQVVMHPDDIIVASTWWTAHIANAALAGLRTDHFIYFIQEYEPFTFPMGTYAALASESYGFAHYPLFSSKLLKEYFEVNQLGIYAKEKGNDLTKAAVFENAIANFVISAESLEKRAYKRVLFYARPEPHASRNMFETGVLALKQAVETGVFDETWEFWAAGTAYGEIPLGKGRQLKMIGKLSLDAYQETLTEFDLGVSLMYTPHPSLVPIEMAAAGMVVITTNCLNKTADKMAAISANIVGVEASVQAIVGGLASGVEKCGDIEGRMEAADVNWPKSWDESLPTTLIHTMVQWFD